MNIIIMDERRMLKLDPTDDRDVKETYLQS